MQPVGKPEQKHRCPAPASAEAVRARLGECSDARVRRPITLEYEGTGSGPLRYEACALSREDADWLTLKNGVDRAKAQKPKAETRESHRSPSIGRRETIDEQKREGRGVSD